LIYRCDGNRRRFVHGPFLKYNVEKHSEYGLAIEVFLYSENKSCVFLLWHKKEIRTSNKTAPLFLLLKAKMATFGWNVLACNALKKTL